MNNDDYLRVEESAALLHAIFPNYPELREINPAPQVEPFLLTLRAQDGANWPKMLLIPLRDANSPWTPS